MVEKMTHKLFELFEKSPLAAALEKQHRSEIQEQRRRVLQQIQSLTAEEAQAIPRLDATIETARDRLRNAQEELKAAKSNLRNAETRRNAVSVGISSKIDLLEGSLRQTADPAILVFVSDLEAMAEKAWTVA